MGDIGTPAEVPISVPAPPHRLPRVDDPQETPRPVEVPMPVEPVKVPEREPVPV